MQNTFSRRGLLFLAPAAAMTIEAKRQADDYIVKTFADLAVLDVAVEDRSGRFVYNLPRQAFQVFENGRPRPVTHFASSEEPLTAGLVLDMSYSMGPHLPALQRAVTTFLDASNSLNEYFVVSFHDRAEVLQQPDSQPFVTQPRGAIRLMEQLRPQGRTAFYDGVTLALSHIQQSRRERRALLLVSDGKDSSSRKSRKEMLEMLRRSPATVHVIGLFDDDEQHNRDEGLLRAIATETGGLYLHPIHNNELDTACARIARDIRARYTLGFPPSPAEESPRHLRRVKVSVRSKEGTFFRVRTRTHVAGEFQATAKSHLVPVLPVGTKMQGD